MVLFTVKFNLVLAACWRVEVINGGLGLALTGFFTISSIDKSLAFIKLSIFLASSSFNKGSDFFLFSEKGIGRPFLSKFIETSQNSSGINSCINLSLSSNTLKATDWTLPAEKCPWKPLKGL